MPVLKCVWSAAIDERGALVCARHEAGVSGRRVCRASVDRSSEMAGTLAKSKYSMLMFSMALPDDSGGGGADIVRAGGSWL